MRRALPLLVLALLVLVPASAHNVSSSPLTLRHGWQFSLDPGNDGLRLGWENPAASFPAQRQVDTGASLADQGVPSYKGISWFRQRISIPAGWERVVLGFGAIDVSCDLYVNGRLLGHYEDKILGSRAASVDLTSLVGASHTALVVFRVVGSGGFGGIKQEVKLGQDESEVMTGQQYLLFLHQQHPDWRLPEWLSSGKRAWVVAGVEGGDTKAIVSTDGSFSPWAGAYGVTFWLYDPELRRLVDFPAPAAHLRDGSSPMPVFDFESGPWRLREELGASGPPQSPALTARLSLLAAPHDAQLFAAVRAYTASGGMATIDTIAVRGRGLVVDGHLAIACAQCASLRGATLSTGDVSSFADKGQLPPDLASRNPRGHAQGLLRTPLGAGQTATFVAPSTQVAVAPAAADLDRTSAAWQTRLHAVQLDLPDRQLQNAYYASLAYILVNEHGGKIHPGPLVHDNFWVRDAAVIGYALERAGLADAVQGSAQSMLAAIGSDGRVTEVSDSAGRVLSRQEELDGAGEAAFGLVEYARYSNDRSFLARAYPAMSSALRFAMAGRDDLGLAPPNRSAEDIGPASQHHYWDDFWLLAGLQEAASAATELGRAADAQQFARFAGDLRSAVLDSVAATGKSYIPNGPEDLESSAMARGATPALWPVPVLDRHLPLVRDSFQTYYQRFVRPNGGAFHHLYGQWWPYAGLDLAHDFLFLDMRPQLLEVLDYTLGHQTAPGLFAWAEGVDPATGGFAEGDMPHAWASAALVSLVHDMLLYEDGDHLVLGAGVPPAWQGKGFSATNVPTRWGPASLRVSAAGKVSLTGVHPPGGVVQRFPFPVEIAQP